MINKASELGPQKFAWWPDWRGECVAIVGSGPSIKGMDLSVLKDRIHVIAIKVAIDLCPWAEVCYGCDAPWWVDRKGLPKYSGIKIHHGIAAKHFPGMVRCLIEMNKDNMLVETPLTIGNGGNSGFQALNLAVQFGATDIIMIGIDCHERGGVHWYGRNTWLNANNPMGTNYVRWMQGFETAKKDLDRLGVTVINASMQSAVKTFRKATLADTMTEWGL
jgi:hypothetical protein